MTEVDGWDKALLKVHKDDWKRNGFGRGTMSFVLDILINHKKKYF